jgi:uncharacterized protein (TIGR00730 family)
MRRAGGPNLPDREIFHQPLEITPPAVDACRGAMPDDAMNDKPSALSALQRICVYCGSGAGRNPAFPKAARDLGRTLAKSRIGLVYGGGSLGLMGELARSALRHGGHVTGVIPGFLSQRELMLKEAHEMHVVDDMHQRKHLMFVKSDAFVALSGGLGTLEELVEQLTWSQLGQHTKPIVLLNIEGYWDPLLVLFERMHAEFFIRPGLELNVIVVDRVEDVIPAIVKALPPKRPAVDEQVEAEVSVKF